ncbi:hypothetical protein D0B54_11535 [Solimonas sp. K1W22B-7]|uniref:4'-phosphopantetheinyl transferase family protein n=1 Tax=Solimonas sp. K1W22B-7 TaxID=2303331 RepID=UPI000E32E6DC|nr:4'-phosphopantetheinyl transferase superfamily protein [Solimonas sp. K1W22B-7]AXQ29282.1 hypothetical protein D0B54_11535 [Solimonas sp. K1W22B-7]
MSITLRLARYAALDAAAQSAGLGFLSSSERRRHDSFTAAARRQQFVASRWLARELLAEHYGGQPLDWELSSEPNAPPAVASGDYRHLKLGLSHSGGWVGCAVSEHPVGLDLETLTRPRKVMLIAATACNEAECAELSALPPDRQLAVFYRMWTLKEAWLKQRGLGLDFSLMRGLHAQPAKGAASALTLESSAAGLCAAVTADAISGPLNLQAEGLRFETSGWSLESRGS